MSFNWFQRAAIRLTGLPAPDDDFWYRKSGGSPTASGVRVSEETSLQSVAYYACIRVIAESIAAQPFNVWEQLPNGDERPVTDHPVADLLTTPNEEQTAFEYIEQSAAEVSSFGNSYAFQELNNKREVTALRLLSPRNVEPYRDQETNKKAFKIINEFGSKTEIIPDSEDRILHIPGMGSDGIRGYSPVQLLRTSLGCALAADEYGARFFDNNAMPPAYVTFPGALSETSRSAIMAWLKAQFGGVLNAHKPGVFEQGGKIETVPINHRDIQFLELRKFHVEEIARMHRVPLHLIQSLERSTNNNIEHQGIDFGTYTVRPWNERIEARFNKHLFGPREGRRLFCRFDMDAIMRGDSAARVAYFSGMRNIGVVNANEIRAKENLGNSYEGGEVYMVQGAMIPVDMAGKTQQQQGATQ